MLASTSRAGLAALAMLSLAFLAPARAGEAIRLAQAPAPVGGTYTVHGTNANGSTYTGTAVVKPDGSVYRFSWLIANGATFKGKGTLKGSTLVVDWGQRYPVIYEVGADGVLHGTWDKGRAKETLVPQK